MEVEVDSNGDIVKSMATWKKVLLIILLVIVVCIILFFLFMSGARVNIF